MADIHLLSRPQVRKLIRKHGKVLSGTINKDKLVYLKLPAHSVEDRVEVQDILGNVLGYITVKDAWAL